MDTLDLLGCPGLTGYFSTSDLKLEWQVLLVVNLISIRTAPYLLTTEKIKFRPREKFSAISK